MKLYPGLKGQIGAYLRIENCPPYLRAELERVLTFKNPDYFTIERYSPWANTTVPEELCLLVDYEKYVTLPRGFDAPRALTEKGLRQWNAIPWEDIRTSFPVKFPKMLATPNLDQLAALKRYRKAIALDSRPFGTNLFVMPTSAGKTMAQGMLAAETGQRTLVLCKTNLIKRAWVEDMYKLYGMNEDDLGEIQQKTYRLGDHITLASIATLSRRKASWTDLFSQIGCLIIDETQIIGADMIRDIVDACPSKFIIGMTATPTRRDGKNYILNNYIGKPVLRIFNKQRETENSYPLEDGITYKTNFRFDDEKGEPIDRDDLDQNELLDTLSRDFDRNKLIVEQVKADWLKGHSVLVSTSRVEHVHTLQKLLVKAGVEDANLLTGTTNSNRIYTDNLVRDIMSKKCRCLVATTQAIKLGANLNPLDRLHIASPTGNVEDLEQLVGRIRRKYPGKKDAKLKWYWDICVPYYHRKYKSVFVPTMRKLRVKRYEDVYIA